MKTRQFQLPEEYPNWPRVQMGFPKERQVDVLTEELGTNLANFIAVYYFKRTEVPLEIFIISKIGSMQMKGFD